MSFIDKIELTKKKKFNEDDLANVPFAIVAVLILVLAIFTTAYISYINIEKLRGSSNTRVDDIQELILSQNHEIKNLMSEAIQKAIDNDTSHQAPIWNINEDSYHYFLDLIQNRYPYRTTTYNYQGIVRK